MYFLLDSKLFHTYFIANFIFNSYENRTNSTIFLTGKDEIFLNKILLLCKIAHPLPEKAREKQAILKRRKNNNG